ncbi:MAG: DMT family transporter, partial [Clostridium sp.]|nr:DMT family transporter [Clostridium sp.]
IVGMVGYHVFFFSALRHTSVINSSLIAAINPIATTIFSVIILNEKLTTKNIIAIGVCFLGIIVVITKGNLGILKTLSFNVGDLYMLVAVIVWALYTVLSKKMLKKYSPIKVTTYVFAMTIVVLIPALIWENPATYIGNTDMKGWLSVLYMALFASTCGYLIQQISIKKIGPMRTNLYYNLVPVFSMILSLLILKTTVSPVQIVAGIFIIVGVLINTSFTFTK